MIFALYIFGKRGECLFYKEWHRARSMLAEAPEEDRKLMFGLIFSLKQLMNKLHPEGDLTVTPSAGSPSVPPMGPDQGFYRFATDAYACHHLETPTGYRFALLTDPSVLDLRGPLWHLYSELFVGFGLRNPLYTPGTPITNPGFATEVERYLRSSLPQWSGVPKPAAPAGAPTAPAPRA